MSFNLFGKLISVRDLGKQVDLMIQRSNVFADQDQAPSLIKELFLLYECHKCLNSQGNFDVPDLAFCFLLWTMAKICYKYHVQDSQILKDIMNGFYETDCVGPLFCYDHGQMIVESLTSLTDLHMRNLNVLEFMLDFTARNRIMFGQGRITENSMSTLSNIFFYARDFESYHAELVLLVCRYGGKLNVSCKKSDYGFNFYYMDLLRRLLYCTYEEISANRYKVEEVHAACCFSILLRTVSHFKNRELKLLFEEVVEEEEEAERNSVQELLLSNVSLSSGLFRSFLEGPPLLTHLARCCIRERLNSNWQLPRGIYELQLPKILEEFLDLHRDCVERKEIV